MFSATIQAYARGRRPKMAVLCEARFATKTMYLHNGGGIIMSRDLSDVIEATQWMGLQGAAQISGLGASTIGNSRKVTVSLALTDDAIRARFAEQETEVKGQKFVFWGQWYDEDGVPLDPKFHIYSGEGDKLTMQKQGPSSRVFTLSLEDWFARRRRSANSFVTNPDQQQRDPGTTGFIYVNTMVDKTLNLYDAKD